MNEKNRVQEFDILRGMGALAVVIIHVTSIYCEFGQDSHRYALFGLINRLCIFAVPLFLFLSAMQFTYLELQKDAFHVGNFYKKRFLKIVPVYLVWVVICYLYLEIFDYWTIKPIQDPVGFFTEYVLQGKVFYHLYFIPLILQLYLLFPVIFWLCKKIRIKADTVRGFAVTCAVLSCFQWCVEYFYTKYISASFSNWAIIVICYVLVIGIGVWCGANYGRMRACAEKWYWTALVWGVIGFVFIHHALYPKEPFLPVWISGSAIWARMMFLTYGSVSSLLLTFLAIRISDKLDWLGRILRNIGRCSFGIYLVHPLVLDQACRRIPDDDILNANPAGSVLLLAVRFAVTFLCSWGIAAFYFTIKRRLRIGPRPDRIGKSSEK